MSKLKIEAVGNGWIVDGEAFGVCVFSSSEAKELIEHVKEELSLDDYGLAPESPQPDSTEAVDQSLADFANSMVSPDPEIEEIVEKNKADLYASEPVQPMADLSGEASKVDWQTGMIKPEAFNGLSPETD